MGTVSVADRKFSPMPKFPSVQRDLAFVVESGVTHAQIDAAIRRSAGASLVDVALFDIYEGAQAGTGKKSVAYALTFRSDRATLTDKEVDESVQKIVKTVTTELNARLRS